MKNINWNNIRLIVNERYDCMSVELWLIQTDLNAQYNISYSDGELVFTQIPELQVLDSTKIKPFMKLPIFFFNAFSQSIMNYFNEKGIKSENDNVMKGKLESTEKHLEDLREMHKKLLDKVIEKL